MKAKASELRIGNLVEYPNWNNDGSKAYFKIRDIYFDDGRIGLTNGSIIIPATKLAYLKPIPLTEEWLFKFGFEKLNTKMSDCFVFQKGLWRVAIKDNIEKTYEWVLWHERISPPTWCLSRFEYVHQLQNFYFALTGKELTLKP
jgi:hypothetical protein